MSIRKVGLLVASMCVLAFFVWPEAVAWRPDQRCALVYAGEHCWNGVYDATWPPERFGSPTATP